MTSLLFRHLIACSRALAGASLVTCVFAHAEAASAAYQCRALFTGSGVALDQAVQSRYEGRMSTLELAIRQQIENAAHHSTAIVDSALVKESLSIAKTQLEARGAKTRAITFQGQPALEILPGNDQWGRIAKSISKIHQTKLLFAPVALAEDFAVATYQRKSEHGRVINVSFESLSIGPKKERQVQHEFGHMDEETRGITPFSGHIASSSDNLAIAKGNDGYSMDMPLDEVPRNVRDLFMRGLDLSRNDDSRSEPLARKRLQEAAVRARSAVSNLSASLAMTNKLRQRLNSINPQFSVGPVAQENGNVQQNAAHFTGYGLKTFLSKTTIRVRGKEEPAISLQVQSNRKWTKIILPWSDEWTARFEGLAIADEDAIYDTIDFLIEHLDKREATLRPVIESTLAAVHFITRNPNEDVKTLAAHAMETRRVIAPLLVRPPRQR